ncbi:dihydrofolate reductase family protein [Chondromyces apiculatus]|uniref:Dihydrofolate reductase n=1 Tax=Chondromyces apiculatus DSM 436 TaxID=1192034 RepID=A0A017THR0_9BACT|nr:dihydrofolate reductase family protein [Chondromyces apiculatus]EYF08818.1 Dihydrofolate reductase [Chondromyces apiculatus DSM 436]
MKTLKYHVASTVDGFIAAPDGTFDAFLAEGEHATDYLDAFRGYDVVLMGRKTYEVGLKYNVTSPYPTMRQIVFSRSMKASPDPQVEIVADDVSSFVRKLKEGEGKAIYLCGGGELASLLLAEGLIDEVVIKLNPVLLGTGIPLFGPHIPRASLELASSKTYRNGVVLLRYLVTR